MSDLTSRLAGFLREIIRTLSVASIWSACMWARGGRNKQLRVLFVMQPNSYIEE